MWVAHALEIAPGVNARATVLETVLILSLALVIALLSFSKPKIEALGAFAGVLKAITFLAPPGVAKGGGCVEGGKLT